MTETDASDQAEEIGIDERGWKKTRDLFLRCKQGMKRRMIKGLSLPEIKRVKHEVVLRKGKEKEVGDVLLHVMFCLRQKQCIGSLSHRQLIDAPTELQHQKCDESSRLFS